MTVVTVAAFAYWKLAVTVGGGACLVFIGLVAWRREMWLRGKRDWWL